MDLDGAGLTLHVVNPDPFGVTGMGVPTENSLLVVIAGLTTMPTLDHVIRLLLALVHNVLLIGTSARNSLSPVVVVA